MKPNPQIDTALHILKGAVQKVLNTPITTGVYAEDNNGRLTVECNTKPTEEQIQEIEKLANQKIEENVEIENFEIDRQEAESKYGNIIYDKFPVPDHIKTLKIVRIPDWNINCCIGEHLKTTGESGNLKIKKWRFRNSKHTLEIPFKIEH